MGKRKRAVEEEGFESKTSIKQLSNGTNSSENTLSKPATVQIIVGTYERVLHGVTATVDVDKDGTGQKSGMGVKFADTFLFNAHDSAIRCLALSPSSKQDKITLASGGSDQTVNLYQLSARSHPTRSCQEPQLPSLAGRRIVEDPQNKELGALQHHAGSINALKFPTRSKFLSAADDNTIAIARTRDWTILSTIKVPIPKAHGRPSGDTAPLGGTPTGVNDFAIHPSMKLMVSVSKGEKCMRLWNLVTGKKAGVLNFEKALLQSVGEGRWARGEGFRVEWNSVGEQFVVAFEKGAAVFGLVSATSDPGAKCPKLIAQDSKPKSIATPSPRSKIHQLRYVDLEIDSQTSSNILAVSTEDGRVIFFSTNFADTKLEASNEPQHLPTSPVLGEIGGEVNDPQGRVKDFEVLKVARNGTSPRILVVTSSSEGSIRVWQVDLLAWMAQLHSSAHVVNPSEDVTGQHKGSTTSKATLQFGQLLGEYETGNRITCLKAFIMADKPAHGGVSRSSLKTMVDTNGGTEYMSDDNSD
ncbi:MAG: hypothetical protein Q9216_000387 [Gyalolechia sp. 2 TL-2023]